MRSIIFYVKRDWTFFITILAFVLTVLFVNPIREVAILDDWAYADTTKYLLETGTYKLHDWLTANMPFQAYWGGLFAFIGGYSFSTLRISTLVLSLLGLIAFYHLAKEHGLNRVQAGILTLAFISNYLYLLLSFTFMSNIPFESTLIIALYLYTRAIRMHSYFFMLLASIAASAAIMTRQFGFALVLGGFCIWVFSPERRRIIKLFLVGFFLPIVAIVWQLLYSIYTPNWAVYLVKYQQKIYFDNIPSVILNIIYRTSIIMQYMALFMLPFILFLVIDFFGKIKNKKISLTSINKNSLTLAVISLYILINIFCGCLIYNSCSMQAALLSHYPKIPIFMTFITALGAILLIRVIFVKYNSLQTQPIPLSNLFLDIVTLFLLFFNLIFYQIGVIYFLVFLPYILILIGQYLRNCINKHSKIITTMFILVLMISSLMVRGTFEFNEAQWKGGEFLISQGIPTNQISCDIWQWDLAHKFADYLKQSNRQYSLSDVYNWRKIQGEKSKFWVVNSIDTFPNKNFSLIKKIPYKTFLLKQKYVYVIERQIEKTDTQYTGR